MKQRDRSAAVVGVFVVAATLAFTLLFVAATNRSFAQRRAALWIALPTAEGLKKGDAVLYRGVQVGEVKQIDFSGVGAVIVRAVLVRPVPITNTASARLIAADMFGRQTVVLGEGNGGRVLQPGDTLHGAPPTSLTNRIEGMASRLERVVGDTTVDALHGLLADAALSLAALERTLVTTGAAVHAQHAPLEAALTHGAGIAANLRAVTDSSALLTLRETALSTMARLDLLIARLDTSSLALSRSLARLENGEGSIGRLASDPELYDRAVAALDSFESLLTDLRRNPKRYINISVF